MKKLLVLLIAFIPGFAKAEAVGSTGPHDTFDRYNVTWTVPSRDSSESMPLGGSGLGANVWVENGDLLLYAQQSGAFDKNGEYLKMGRFRIKLDPNPLAAGGTFKQELKLREGHIVIAGETPEAGRATIKLWIEVKRPVIHVEVEAEQAVALTAAYESWRYRDVDLPPEERPATGRRSSIFDYDGYQVTLVKKGDTIEPGADGIVWFHDVGQDFNAFDFSLQIEELTALKSRMWDPLVHRISGGSMRGANLAFAGTSEGVYVDTPYRAWNFHSREPARSHRVEIVGLVEQPTTPAAWKAKLAKLVGAKFDPARLWQENLAGWAAFWDRAYVIVNPGKDAADNGWRVGRNYQLFRYQLGGNLDGQAPTKFNGGNLTFDAKFVNAGYNFGPDYRRWGGWSYTAYNQQEVYWGFLKNGDFEGMLPQFDVYRHGLVNAAARTQAHWGHAGCSFAEQFQHSGMPVVSHYGFVENGFSFFGRPKNFEKGEMVNPWISTLYHGQLNFAFMILEYWRFSGRDITPYLPFIDASIRFYDEHYQMKHRERTGRPLGDDGKLVIFPSTPGEHHLNSTNPADAVAGLQAIVPALLALPTGTLSAAAREYYAGLQRRLPELPTLQVPVDGQEHTVFAIARDSREAGGSFPALHCVFPYNLEHFGSANFARALDTWRYQIAPAEHLAYVGHRPSVIYAARFGQTDEAKTLIAQKLDDPSRLPAGGSNNRNRFPSFWGPGFDWTPDHNWAGSGMIGLQEMLLQTYGDSIHLLPAWPKDWDVDFKLHAPGNTTVEGRFAHGKLIALKVTPQAREKDVVYSGAR